jgi:alpha-ketoglutarate-dependent taurine dioxygenase
MTIQVKVAAVEPELHIRRLQPVMGAEISGVDLREPLGEATRKAVNDALCRYKVVFFRDQDISREQHIAFGRAFGDLQIHPFQTDKDYPEIAYVKADGTKGNGRGADVWHTDNAYEKRPPAISILRALQIPSLGGDTMFANAVAAYEGLSDAVKARIENLWSVHDAMKTFRREPERLTPEVFQKMDAQFTPRPQPVVRIHPETGERALFVADAYSTHIIGLDPAESDTLLRHLLDQFKRPEYQLRFQWRPHSIAMWDNRAAQHYAIFDYDEPRYLERVIVTGDVPKGPAS